MAEQKEQQDGAVKAETSPNLWNQLVRQAQARSKSTKREPAQSVAEWARALVRRSLMGGEK